MAPTRLTYPKGQPESALVRQLFGTPFLDGEYDKPLSPGHAPVTKSNPYHDERGRFTTAGSGGGGRDLPPEVQFMARKWANGYHPYIRAGLSGDLSGLTRDNPTVGQIRVAQLRDGGRLLLKSANDAPPTKYSLYRGLGVTEAQRQQMLDSLKPGATVDMNLSSWTRSENVANQFASNSFNTNDIPKDETFRGTGLALHRVIFAVDPGAHALDVTNLIPQGPQYSEHLMAGRFEVTQVSHGTVGTIKDLTVDTISLRQVGTLDAAGVVGTKVVDLAKYNEAEPRDERGRWTSDGTEYAAQRSPMKASTAWDPSTVFPPKAWGGSITAAIADLSARHPNTRFDASLAKGNPARVLPALAAFGYCATRWPGVRVDSVDLTTFRGKDRGAMAYTQISGDATRISLGNWAYGLNSKQDPWATGSKGWLVAGTNNPGGAMFHEFGHAVQSDATKDAADLFGRVTPTQPMLDLQEAMNDHAAQQARALSGYAFVGVFSGQSEEYFAEAFAAAANPDSRSKDLAVAQAMDTFINTEPALKIDM